MTKKNKMEISKDIHDRLKNEVVANLFELMEKAGFHPSEVEITQLEIWVEFKTQVGSGIVPKAEKES